MKTRSRLLVLTVLGIVIGVGFGVGLRPAAAQVPFVARPLQTAPINVSGARLFKFGGQTSIRTSIATSELQAPPPLTDQQRTAIAAAALGAPPSQPGQRYLRVDARAPFTPARGGLVYRFAKVVDPIENWALFMAPSQPDAPFGLPSLPDLSAFQSPLGHARLWIKSETAGRRYVADCEVSRNSPLPLTMRVHAPGIEQTTRVETNAHLNWVLSTTDANWYEFEITGDQPWGLRSCEVTSL